MKINKKELIDYLYSHIELEHILLDSIDKFNTDKLECLKYDDLLELSRLYNYFD